jgi:glyoxylase-like metal-dependent hydrolase (beta-lactamase superfamily II)
MQAGGGWNSNSGLIVGKDYAVLIDSQTNKHQAANLIKAIKKVTDKPIRLLFNTHFHPDHTWTNHMFTEAITFCTEACRQKTLELGPHEQDVFQKYQASALLNFEGAVKTPQTMTFDGRLTIYLDCPSGTKTIHFIELGTGHSHTDSIVFLPKEKIVFGGDIVGVGEEGNVTDFNPRVPGLYSGGSDLVYVMYNLAQLDADVFVPGHGTVLATRADVARQAAAAIEGLIFFREEARRVFNKGVTYQEAVDLLDYDKLEKLGFGTKEQVSRGVLGTLARMWLEFEGYPEGTMVDIEEVWGQKLGRPEYVKPPPPMKMTGQKPITAREIDKLNAGK